MVKKVPRPAEIDIMIINILTEDADLTYKEIARKLGLNASTVRKRILSLKRRGVIRRFTVEVDEKVLGRNLLNAIFAINVDPTKYIGIVPKLVAIPQVTIAYQTSGAHDIFLVLLTVDKESLAQLVKDVRSIDGITNIIPSIIIERLR